MRANHISTLGFLCSHFRISSSGHFQISFVCYRFPVSLRQIFFPSLFSPVIPGTQSKMYDNTKTYKQHSQISPRPPRCVHRNTFCSTWKKALSEKGRWVASRNLSYWLQMPDHLYLPLAIVCVTCIYLVWLIIIIMITVKRVTGVCLQCQWGIYYKGGEGGLLSSIRSNALDISADHHIAMINTSMNTRFSFIYNDNINVFT